MAVKLTWSVFGDGEEREKAVAARFVEDIAKVAYTLAFRFQL